MKTPEKGSWWNSSRLFGKVLTYIGLFLTGMGMVGGLQPHMELQKSPKLAAQVVSNDIGFRQPGIFAFRLQLKWMKPAGEQRTTITFPVRAPSEEAARRAYRGRELQPGQTYEFYASPDDPDRILPFRGYNWGTFGTFLVMLAGGIVLFILGMWITKRGRALASRGR